MVHIRRLHVENLPRHTSGTNTGKIDWDKCVGMDIEFTYDQLNGCIKLLKKNKSMLTVQYKENEFNISQSNFLLCHLKKILGLLKYDYEYNIGDIVGNLEILERKLNKYNNRGYITKCRKCGFIDEVPKLEYTIKNGVGCAICNGNNKVVYGLNSVYDTDYWMVKYFKNKEDAKKIASQSGRLAWFKCDKCGNKQEKIVSQVKNRGFSCNMCSDGISYPNKFIYSLLTHLDCDFKTEIKFEWSMNKQYDIYIPSLNIIVENHGGQHYRECTRGRSLEDEQINDEIKEMIALCGGIEGYIVLDCRESKMEWIKNSVMSSKLPRLLNFTEDDIDWIACDICASGSFLIDVCNIWNRFDINSISEIASMLNISTNSVYTYLKKGTSLGLCKYDGSFEKSISNKKNKNKLRMKYYLSW